MGNMNISLSGYNITPLFLLLLIGAIAGVISFVILTRLKNTPGVKFWMIWQLASSFWAFTYAFEFAAYDISTKIIWSKFSYFGIVYCPVSFLFFALAFASQYRFLKKRIIIGVYAFASLFILFPFTNNLHHLHWKSYSIDPVSNATNYVYGPMFWLMTIFAYTAITIGIISIFILYFKSSKYYRRQITFLLVACLVPLIGNLIYIFHINPISGFDWTPIAFLFTGLLIAINLNQFKMFELVHFARNQLFDIIPDAILVIDNSHLIADLNLAMRRLIDTYDNELIGKSVDEIFPQEKLLIAEIQKQDNFQTQLTKEIEGTTLFYEMQATTLIDQNKQKTGLLIIFKEITRHIVAEEKIKETNVQLMAEIKEKERLIADLDSFSHTVAHDLKNMLGAIVSASNLITMGIDNMKKDDLLEINELIRQSATKTMHITRELLTLASVRKQEVKPVNINMQPIVIEAIKRLNDIIAHDNAQIIMPPRWHEVLGYEGWLEEVWVNYISNAIKYGGTPPVIQLGSEILDDQRVKFWIKDNGKGISDEDRKLLYHKFTRLDTLRAEGHGLGLSIVKRIIEKLNGEVGVDSTNIPGEGCTFYFILPTK